MRSRLPTATPSLPTSIDAIPYGGVQPSHAYVFCVMASVAVSASNTAKVPRAALGIQLLAIASRAALISSRICWLLASWVVSRFLLWSVSAK